MIDEQPQNILLDAEIVGDDAIASRVVFEPPVRFTPAVIRPGARSARPDRIEPRVQSYDFGAGDAAGKFLPRHRGQRARFGDQLFGGGAVGRDDAAQRAHSRRCRTSARVSRSQITGTPCRSDIAARIRSERQLEASAENSRTISASM